MKRRDHTASVSCLLAAVAFLLIQGVAVAQEFMPPPAGYPGRPSLVVGRFYIQGGVQYRNIQRFGFQRFLRPYSYVQAWGVAPFGGDVEGRFGTGTGVPGYPTTPDGVDPDPNVSGVWLYDNGAYIDPNGVYFDIDPVTGDPVTFATLWDATRVGLGQKIGPMSDGTMHYQFDGFFNIANTPDNVQGGFQLGGTLDFVDTTYVSFRRTLDASVNGYGNGQESIIWTTMGPEFNKNFSMAPISPTIEMGFQWTNFFDLFAGFSWYDMDINFGATYNLLSTLSRRGVKDTFPYSSSRDGAWQTTTPSNSYHPSDLIESDEGVWDIILPDAARNGIAPHREFYFLRDASVPPAPTSETIALHTDVRVYEYRAGVRSWIPLYGLGRFGVVFGPLVNQIGYNTSLTRVTTIQLPQAPVTLPYYEQHSGTLLSWGIFAGGDVEVAFGQYYAKFGANYNLSEEKVIKTADSTSVLSSTLTLDPSTAVDTNINVSGFNMGFNLGLRY